jgi:ATPase subunit of ABC transporter with duplicated ATPase domains
VDQIFIPAGPRLGDVVVDFKGVTKSFGAKQLLSGADFSLPPGAIVGVVGPNGAGKTTLVKMILGDEQPDSGEVNVGSTVKITAVRQERMEGLEGDKTAWADISDELDEIELGAGVKMNSRAYCSLFGLKSGLQQTKVKELSGGERNRCLLAKAVKSGANFIILDEPTNDLDTEVSRPSRARVWGPGRVRRVLRAGGSPPGNPCCDPLQP